MIIVILILVALFCTNIIFSREFREFIIQSGILSGVLAQGVWQRVILVLRVARRRLLILWIVSFFAFWFSGWHVNAGWPGFILGILIPLWSVLYVLKDVTIIRKAIRIPWRITTAIVFLALPLFLLGLWSPDVKSGYDQWSARNKKVLAAKLFKNAANAKSEVYYEVKEETEMFNDELERSGRIRKGAVVMVLDMEVKSDNTEPLIKVMTRDETGHFINGKKRILPRSALVEKQV